MRLTAYSVLALVAAAGTAGAEDQIYIKGTVAGSQTVATDLAGVTRAEYSFNDRGRGDHIVATWKLDAQALGIASRS